MPYDKSDPKDRAAITARLQHWFDRVPSRAVDQWIAVFNGVVGRTRDEGRAIASANSVIHRRFPAGHAAFLSPAVTQGAKVLATVLGKKALRELELTLQSCECGQDHARTLAMVQAALRIANAAVGNPSGPAGPAGSRSTRVTFSGAVASGHAASETRFKSVGIDLGWAWNVMARDVYENGDKLFLAVREMLQNSRDARATEIDVTWTEDDNGETGTLVFEDNGRGMDLDTVEGKFLVLGASRKDPDAEAIGGFGAAKAAILTASTSGWSWDLRTRNVWTKSGDFGTYMEPVLLGPEDTIQGTRITIPGMSAASASTPLGSGPPIDRINILLACSDLRGINVRVNGREVTSYFENRRGKNETEYEEGLTWGPIVPKIRSYARPAKKGGAIIVRVKGLAQFAVAPPHGAEFQRDYVLDFEIPKGVVPNTPAYPFKSGRDAFVSWSRPYYAFEQFKGNVIVKSVQDERDLGEYEEIRPDNTDPREAKAQAQFDDLLGEVLGGEKNRDVLAEIAGVTDEMSEVIGEALAHGKIQPSNERPEASDRPPTTAVVPTDATVKVLDGLLSSDIGEQADKLLALAHSTLADGDVVGFDTAIQRLRAGHGYADDLVVVAQVAKGVVERLAPNASQLYTAGLVAQIVRVLEGGVRSYEQEEVKKAKKRGDLNPFGGAACIFVSRSRYGVEEGAKFRRGARKFMRHLAAWDFTVRAIMSAAATQARWPRLRKLSVGFVLDNEVLGLTDKTGSFVMVNPHALARVAESYQDRPFIVAAWLHGLACHEIAHAMRITSDASSAHNESWSIVREMLADSTLFLIPVIEEAAATLLKLKRRTRRRGPRTAEAVDNAVADKLAQTERDLAEARAQIEDYRRAEGQRTRLFTPGPTGFAHRLASLVDIWEFQEYLRSNPGLAEAKGIPVEVILETLRGPRGAEDLIALLDDAELRAEGAAASRGLTALSRAGLGLRADAAAARQEAASHAACPGCGGTCGGANKAPGHAQGGGRLTVSAALFELWLEPLGGVGDREAFQQALRRAARSGHRWTIDLDAHAAAYLRDPLGPVHRGADILRDRLRNTFGASEASLESTRNVLNELVKLSALFPVDRGHAACGCGAKRVILVGPSGHPHPAGQHPA